MAKQENVLKSNCPNSSMLRKSQADESRGDCFHPRTWRSRRRKQLQDPREDYLVPLWYGVGTEQKWWLQKKDAADLQHWSREGTRGINNLVFLHSQMNSPLWHQSRPSAPLSLRHHYSNHFSRHWDGFSESPREGSGWLGLSLVY